MRQWTLLFSLLLLPNLVFASEALRSVSYKSVTELTQTTPDEMIRYGEQPDQFIEAWLPDGEAKELDIVFIHGGCWLKAYDIVHSRSITADLKAKGYRTWSLEYRRSDQENPGWPHSLEDVVQAVQSLAKNGKLVLSNTVLMGHSAGGHLALLAAAKQLPDVKAVVGLAAITDINSYAQGENGCQKSTLQFMGGSESEKPEQYLLANPISHKLHTSSYLIYGDADNIVPVAQSQAVATSQQILVAGAGHFDFIHPQSQAWLKALALLETLE